MKPCRGWLYATLFVANYCHLTGANAQNSLKNADSPPCVAAADVTPRQLHGLWHAEWPAAAGQAAQAATLRLEPHREFTDSLSGHLRREDAGAVQIAQVAGDLDAGEFTLEESLDGHSVHAVWQGHVNEASCGKEITGTWNSTSDRVLRPFVLRQSARTP